MAAANKKQRSVWLHMPVVLTLSAYAILQALPPWVRTCDQYLELYECRADVGNFGKIVDAVDCTVQGYSHVQHHIVWLLLTPRLMPSLKWMHFNIFWILGMNLGASLWFNALVPSNFDFYTLGDVFLTMCLLLGCHAVAFQRKFYMSKSQESKFVNEFRQREA